MAYSLNPVTFKRMASHLEPLRESSEVVWRTEPNRSRWFAYKVREALALLREEPELDPELARRRWRVEVTSSREVRARESFDHRIEVVPQRRAKARVETQEVTVDRIVHDWVSKEGADRLYYPNANLEPDNLLSLYEWAQEDKVLLFENAGALTLLSLEGNEDAAEFAWTPQDLEVEDA